MSETRELSIIITDDDDGHAELIREGLVNSGIGKSFIRFSNGEDLWNFLTGKKLNHVSYDSRKTYVVLLDINMPRLDGIEVLQRIKEHAILRRIPVIILTTTDDPAEVERCYGYGCNVYITKPVDFSLFTETLHRLGQFLQVMTA
jgi:Response regulator containing a CheY-like receiver domain and an HD-GYP domain